MWRTMLGAGIGGAVCLQLGSWAALGLGWFGGLGWIETLILVAVVGAAVGVPGALVGAGAARAGSPLPLVVDDDPNDGPAADYRELPPAG